MPLTSATINDALVHALISLMTVVEDSNVIWRTDYDTLLEVQRIAKNILSLVVSLPKKAEWL